MSDLERFRALIEQLRPIAAEAEKRRDDLSPLAQLWAREIAGTARVTLKSAYRAHGLLFVVSGIAHLLDPESGPAMAPWDLIPILEEIAALEAGADTTSPRGGSDGA